MCMKSLMIINYADLNNNSWKYLFYNSLLHQVCHHPPISACHADSENFSFWQGDTLLESNQELVYFCCFWC